MRHPALSYTPRLLMLGTQQVLHHFDGREGRNGHVHEDRVPLRHGAVPQAGSSCARRSRPPTIRRNETRRGSVYRRRSNWTLRIAHAADEIDRIEVRGRLHQRQVVGRDLARSAIWSDCVPSGFPTQKGPPPGSPSLRTMPQTRIGRSSTARSTAESYSRAASRRAFSMNSAMVPARPADFEALRYSKRTLLKVEQNACSTFCNGSYPAAARRS